MVAVVAGLIAAVKLAGVESIELQNRSPRVRSAISDSITLARIHRGQQSEMNWHQAKSAGTATRRRANCLTLSST
jgi:hypothetical protein